MLDGAAKVKLWVFEIRIVYDDVRRVSRTALMQVHDLARHITTLVLRLDCCLLIMTSGVAPHGPRNSHLEWRLDPNTKVPRIGELDPLQKHTVEKKDGIRGCCLIRQVHRPIISVIKHSWTKVPNARGTEWIQQLGSQGGIIERIEKVALRRIHSPLVAAGAGGG